MDAGKIAISGFTPTARLFRVCPLSPSGLTVPHKCSAESAEFRGAIAVGRCESWGALAFPLEAVAIFAETETVHAMTA